MLICTKDLYKRLYACTKDFKQDKIVIRKTGQYENSSLVLLHKE